MLEPAELYRLIADNTQDLIRVFDVEGRFVYASPSHETLLGYTPQDLLQTSVMDLLHPDDVGKARSMLHEMVTRKVSMHGLFRYRSKAGPWRILETRGTPLVKEKSFIGVVTIGRDITERWQMERALQEYQAELEFLAFHDALTGLPNRVLFSQQVTKAISAAEGQSHRLAVLFLDYDQFKSVNDTYGHDIGDQVVQECGRRIAQCVGDEDTVARLGGDEFSVLMPRICGSREVTTVATRILQSTRSPWNIGAGSLSLTVSIGIALYPTAGLDAPSLVKHADNALYDAKRRGKNRYAFYRPGMGV